VEVVASIVGRAESLCALFFLLAILFYLKRTPGESYVSIPTLLSLLFFFCALLSKEMAISLPLVLIMLENLRKENSLASPVFPSRIAAYVHTYLPYLAVLILYLTIRVWVVEEIGIRKDMTYFAQRPGIQFITTMPIVFALYLKLLILPLQLNADYNFPILLFGKYFIEAPKTILSFSVVIGLATLIAYLGLSVYAVARSRPLAIALLWFLITLLPVSNIIPFGDMMAERFLYLPSIGFCAVVGGVLAAMVERHSRTGRPQAASRQLAWAIFICLLVFYGARSAIRNHDWRDEIAFWKSVMRDAPTNSDAYYGLAHSYADKRMEALKKYNALKEQGDFSAAMRYHDDAVHYEQKAIECYRLTVQKDPTYYEAYYNLAGLLMEAKEPDYVEARRFYEEGLKQYPRNWKNLDVFYFGIGLTYAFTGEYREAAEYFETAIRFKSSDPKYYINLGSAYANLRQYALARKAWLHALEVDPSNTEAIKNLEKLKRVLNQAKQEQPQEQTR
jgi:tetratricopeptide (TPR) repeat protein